MNRVILALLILSGCATPTYITKHGVKVFDKTVENTPTQQEVEEVTQYVIDRLGGDNIDGSSVMLINTWIHIPVYNKPDEVSLADGYTDIWDRELIASVFQSCFADSGYPHELAHLIHDYNAQIPDWWHDDKKFWDMIKELEKQIVKDLCPPDYVHREIPPDYKPNQ